MSVDTVEPTGDGVGKIDMMIQQLFDTVYPSRAERSNGAAHGALLASLVVAAATAGDAAAQAAAAEEAAGGGKKGGKKDAAKKKEPPPPSPAPDDAQLSLLQQQEQGAAAAADAKAGRPFDAWLAQSMFLLEQQGKVTAEAIATEEEALLRRYRFLKAPPPHLKELVKRFMRNLGPFEHFAAAPTLPAAGAGGVFSRRDLTLLQAKQLCLAKRDVHGFTYTFRPAEGGGGSQPQQTNPGAYPAGPIAEVTFFGSGLVDPDALALLERENGAAAEHTFVAFPEVSGTWEVSEGAAGRPYETAGVVALEQSGRRLWGTRKAKRQADGAEGGADSSELITGAIQADGSVAFGCWGGPGVPGALRDAAMPRGTGKPAVSAVSAAGAGGETFATGDADGRTVVGEFGLVKRRLEGTCFQRKSIKSAATAETSEPQPSGPDPRLDYTWAFRMEQLAPGRAVESAQVEVVRVLEIYENAPERVSVKFLRLPEPPAPPPRAAARGGELSAVGSSDPVKLVPDFRLFYLSQDLHTIYGCAGWMTGAVSAAAGAAKPVADDTTHPSASWEDVSLFLVDVPLLVNPPPPPPPPVAVDAALPKGGSWGGGSGKSVIRAHKGHGGGDQGAVILPSKPKGGKDSGVPALRHKAAQAVAAGTAAAGLTLKDATILKRMNAVQNHVVNPRTLPPGAPQPDRALIATLASEPLHRQTAGNSAANSFVAKTTHPMHRAVPLDSSGAGGGGIGQGGAVFAASPPSIEFPSDFQPGRVYRAELTLVNKDRVSRRVQLLPPAGGSRAADGSPTPSFSSGRGSPGEQSEQSSRGAKDAAHVFTCAPAGNPAAQCHAALAPGMCMRYEVVFRPAKTVTYRSALTVATEWGSFAVPVSAVRTPPQLTGLAAIDLGDALVGGSLGGHCKVSNTGGGSLLRWEVRDPAGLRTAAVVRMEIRPETFAIDSGQCVECAVACQPIIGQDGSGTGAFAIPVCLIRMDEGETSTVVFETTVSYRVSYPRVEIPLFMTDPVGLRDRTVKFCYEQVTTHGELGKDFVFRNVGSTFMRFAWACDSLFDQCDDGHGDPAGAGGFSVELAAGGTPGEPSEEPGRVVFSLPPGDAHCATIHFKPAREGRYRGSAQLIALSVPTPLSEAHPLWGLERLQKTGGGSGDEDAEAEDQRATGDYVVASITMTGEGVPPRLEVIPEVLDCAEPCLPSAQNRREIVLKNTSTRDLSFWVDPAHMLHGDDNPFDPNHALLVKQRADANLTAAAGVAAYRLRDLTRAVSVSFDPPRGTIPPGESAAVAVAFSCFVVGPFSFPVAIAVDQGTPAVFRLQGSVSSASISVNPPVLSLSDAGVVSTSLRHTNKGPEQAFTVANPSALTLVASAYDPIGHQKGVVSLEDQSSAGTFAFLPESQVLPGMSKGSVTLAFDPPDAPCRVQRSIHVVAASPSSTCANVLEDLTVPDLRSLLDDACLLATAECPDLPESFRRVVALLTGLDPPTEDNLLGRLSDDRAAQRVLASAKTVDVSKKGLNAAKANRARFLGLVETPAAITLLARFSEVSSETVKSSPYVHVDEGAGKVLAWARLVTSFVLSLRASLIRVGVQAEVQRVQCRLAPRVQRYESLYINVPQTLPVTISNLSGLDATYSWGSIEDDRMMHIAAEPATGLVPAGSSVSVLLKFAVLQPVTGEFDCVVPCAIREVGAPMDAAPEFLAVNVVAGAVRGLELVVTPSAAIDFGTIPLHTPVTRTLTLSGIGGGEALYAWKIARHPAPAPLPRPSRDGYTGASFLPSALLSGSKTAGKLPFRRSGKGWGSEGQANRTPAGSLAAPERSLDQCASSPKRDADLCSEMLAGGGGFVMQVEPPGKAVLRTGETHSVVVSAVADLPGVYNDELLLFVEGEAEPRRYPVTTRVVGQIVRLSLATPGLSLRGDDVVPLLTFPTCIATPKVRKTKKIVVYNDAAQSVRVLWDVAANGKCAQVSVDGETGRVRVLPLASQSAVKGSKQTEPQDVVVHPRACVIPGRRNQSFEVSMRLDRPGEVTASLTCSATPVQQTLVSGKSLCDVGADAGADTVMNPVEKAADVDPTKTDSSTNNPTGESNAAAPTVPLIESGSAREAPNTPTTSADPEASSAAAAASAAAETPESRPQPSEAAAAAEFAPSIPLCIDVRGQAVSSVVHADPSTLKLACRGAPGPFDVEADGYRKSVRLTNPLPAAVDFQVAADPPFTLTGYTLLKSEAVRPITAKNPASVTTTLFRLHRGDALDIDVTLIPGQNPVDFHNWSEFVRPGGYGGAKSVTFNGDSTGESGVPAHLEKGKAATQHERKVKGSLRVSFSGGINVQHVPLQAILTYPAVSCDPPRTTFGYRKQDRNPSQCKRVYLKSVTSAPATFRIVHKAVLRPVTQRQAANETDHAASLVSALALETSRKIQSKTVQRSGANAAKARTAQKGGILDATARGQDADELQLQEAAPGTVDDPNVFTFSPSSGVLPGGDETSALTVKVSFSPRGSTVFESVFSVLVEGGRGCDITVCGVSAEDEYGAVADSLRLMPGL
ncbi:hypothetical protein DIPPA_20886 [Diplonema papillatum]|nr:hypothetical protein DIPPA_20886 [Diplonema papillatum]